MNRRDALGLLTTAGLAPLVGTLSSTKAAMSDRPEIHVFSKHLQWLDYEEMAETAARIGFDGVDLTVRPGGHVEPARVTDDLPRAVDALRRHSLQAVTITTAVTDARDATNRSVLQVAAALGIRQYRTGWFRHPEDRPMPESLAAFQDRLRGLADLNATFGIRGAYQNHAGDYVGASIWELHRLLEPIDPAWIGCQYDIRHATVEGGLSWPQGLRLIHDRIVSLVVKDMRWGTVDDRWIPVDTPVGEGMVDFPRYVRLLNRYGVNGPVTLHLEYPLGGAEHGHTRLTLPPAAVEGAMARDLATVRRFWSS